MKEKEKLYKQSIYTINYVILCQMVKYL